MSDGGTESIYAALRAAERDVALEALHDGPSIRGGEDRRWFVTSYHECAALLRDPRLSSDTRNAEVLDGFVEESATLGGSEVPVRPHLFFDPPTYIGGRPFLFLDDPDHGRLRRLVARAFTPRAIARIEERARELTRQALADGGEELDLVEALAYPLPVQIIVEILGLDEQHLPLLRECAGPLATMLNADEMLTAEEREAARRALFSLAPVVFGEIEERRSAPRDDLLSDLVHAEVEGDGLTVPEVGASIVLLLIAGHETTASLIGTSARLLLEHPDQRRALEAGAVELRDAVEELLRFEPPVQLASRSATEPLSIDGAAVQPGDHVVLVLAAANRDPRRFAEPSRFDITRRDADGHLAFGAGPHHCLGAALARLEATACLEELLPALERMEVSRLEMRPDLVLRGPRRLDVVRV